MEEEEEVFLLWFATLPLLDPLDLLPVVDGFVVLELDDGPVTRDEDGPVGGPS